MTVGVGNVNESPDGGGTGRRSSPPHDEVSIDPLGGAGLPGLSDFGGSALVATARWQGGPFEGSCAATVDRAASAWQSGQSQSW